MIAVVDYKAGNIGSIINALERFKVRDYVVTSDKEIIKSADGVIFPGQGRAGPAMESLKDSGLDVVLPELKQPFLGICLGMQLLMEETEEDNVTALGVIAGKVSKLQVGPLPVPHVGWNMVTQIKESTLLDGIASESYCYFANSYAVTVDSQSVVATADYGITFGVVVEKDNFFGVQFHPEKSSETGRKILINFLKLCGVTIC